MSEKKSRIEVQNCKELLELLKLPVRELRPCSPDPPDVLACMESGERIGIEVVHPRDNKSKHHTRFFEAFALQVTKALREEGINARMIARWASPTSIKPEDREASIHALLSLLKEKQPCHEDYLALFDSSDCSHAGDIQCPKCDLLKYWTHIRACAAQQGEFDIEFPDDLLLGKYP